MTSSELESDAWYHVHVYSWCHLVKATEVTADLAESNGSLLLGGWLSHLRVDCLYIGSAASQKLGNEYGRTLPLPPSTYNIPEYVDGKTVYW